MRPIVAALFCASLSLSAVAEADDDLLGLYVGGGLGQSTVKQDYYQINAHELGWKALIGWRPIRAVSAEVEYVNFGGKTLTYQDPSITESINTKVHAAAVFVVGYLPVPQPYLDVYGKAGVARINQDTRVGFTCLTPSCVPIGPSQNTNSNGFAWGLGAQFKFGMPSARLEWENFHGYQGNASLISVALILNF
jgi:opacity protein-like surface antigen